MKKKAILLAAIAISALAPITPGFSAPAIAAPATEAQRTSGTLIDKDFEVALRKFISKRFYNKIDASAEQREKLDSIFANTQEETRPDREHFRQGLLDLSALMSNDKASDEEITKKAHEVRDMRTKIMDKRMAAALEVRKVLTPEQKQKIHDRLSELIGGGAKPRGLSFLMNAGKIGFLNDN